MRTVAIIQARTGSTRLPGKVLLTLAGHAVLEHVITRVRACELLDAVVVATTMTAADDEVAALAARCGIDVYRGSELDVLDRYYQAARMAGAQTIVRVTADCPLFDGALLSAMLRRFHAQTRAARIDYLANGLVRTYPRGLDAEVFTADALCEAHRHAVLPHQREHVTPYIYEHPERFALHAFTGEPDLSHHRWTLDTPADYQLLEAIFGALYRDDELFDTAAVLDLLAQRPDLASINAHVQQKAIVDA